MRSIYFIGEGEKTSASVVHRCSMISDKLVINGCNTNVFTSGFILKRFLNLNKQINNWKMIIKEKPDAIIIHRSSNIIDNHMVKKAKKYCKIIYDFDDALFHMRFPGRNICYSHINDIIKISDIVFAGSHYLLEYSKAFNKNVFLIPTPVDTNMFHPIERAYKGNQTVIGWLGNGTKFQLRYLRLLKEPLIELSKKYDIQFKMVSALSREIREEFKGLGFKTDFGPNHWIGIKEIPSIISDFDIGVMPLIDEPFARGKCSMKVLEYMSMEIPVVASGVGENNYVINNGYNGFLASNSNEWKTYLENLIIEKNLRTRLGKNGRKSVMDNYSLNVVSENIINIINDLI